MSFRSIRDPVKLRRVLEATRLLEGDVELPALLTHILEEARSITGARYGALGILDEAGTAIGEFLTVGLTDTEEKRIGARPTGRGLLGALIADPHALRLADLTTHAASSGFPPHHPPMVSFLGVPIKVRMDAYGILYLTDKVGPTDFTLDDEALVDALAIAAGLCIENTLLHQRVRELAVVQDRDRTARDLHDTVIQHLYAVGLSLESMANEAAAAGMKERLEGLISAIGETMRQVRSSIYELGSSAGDPGVRADALALVRSMGPMVGFDIRVSFDGPVDTVISGAVTEHLLATVREAVTNVGRHAHATEASVTIGVEQGVCRLEVTDNGIGLHADGAAAGGLGLVNLRHRAESLDGLMSLESPETGGTRLIWQVPVSQ